MLTAMLIHSSLKIRIYIVRCCQVYWHDVDSERVFNLQFADSDKATVQKTLSSQQSRYLECPGQPTFTYYFITYTSFLRYSQVPAKVFQLHHLVKKPKKAVVIQFSICTAILFGPKRVEKTTAQRRGHNAHVSPNGFMVIK